MADFIVQHLQAQVSITNVTIAVVAIVLLRYSWTIFKARRTLPNRPVPWPIVEVHLP